MYFPRIYVSGTYGMVKDGDGADTISKPGKVGAELTVEEGYESARFMLRYDLAWRGRCRTTWTESSGRSGSSAT